MIDWSCVKTLIDEIGEVDFGEVVPLFLAEMDESVDNLASAQADGALPQTLHFLKGSSLNLGFYRFSEKCAEGESTCKRGEADTVDLSYLLDLYQQSRRAFLLGLEKDAIP